MHLRKLAWLALLPVSAFAAPVTASSGGVQEGATVATLALAEPMRSQGLPTPSSPAARARQVARDAIPSKTLDKPASVQASSDGEPSSAERDVKGLITLVGALALVGVIQRRRPEA